MHFYTSIAIVTGIMLSANNLLKSYGGLTVVDHVSLNVQKGEIVSIVGPSGAGKSTLLHLIGALDKPDSGSVSIDGTDIFKLPSKKQAAFRNKHIGFVFQFHFLMLEFTALENVMMPMRKLGKLTQDQMVARATQLLESVGLGEKTHRLGTQLSGGEQQRVAVARALANQPAINLADEPTGNLDVTNSGIVFDLLTRLAKENGQAVILVTHNPEIAARCDVRRPMRDGLFVE